MTIRHPMPVVWHGQQATSSNEWGGQAPGLSQPKALTTVREVIVLAFHMPIKAEMTRQECPTRYIIPG